MAGGSDADTAPTQAQPPAAASAAVGAAAAVAAPPPAAAPAEPAAALPAAIAADDLEYQAEVQAGIALFRRLAAQLDGGGPEPDWEPLRGRPGKQLGRAGSRGRAPRAAPRSACTALCRAVLPQRLPALRGAALPSLSAACWHRTPPPLHAPPPLPARLLP